jgi:hypothetical protein
MVTIYVGPKRKEFIVHKKLLCGSADYFKGAFTRDFEEARNGEMYMPEDSSGAFSLFVDWLYRSSIPMSNTEAHLNNLYELYFLANKLCLISLKDKTMDAIQDMASKYDLKDELIKPELVKKVMKTTPTKHEGLRKFCVHQMVYVYLERYKDDPRDDEESENEYEPESETEDELASGEDFVLVKRKDLRTVFQIGRNDFRFLGAFIDRLSQQLQDGTNDLCDVRVRIEDDPDDRCFFHCHKRSSNCCLGPDIKAGDFFVPNTQ